MDATSALPGWLAPSLRGYRGTWLRADVVAGLAAGVVVVPQAMAYATIAGLPVAVGLYTCMVPVVLYALLGGSHTLSVSTTSTIAVLTASTLAASGGSAGGAADRAADDVLGAAFTLTALVGACLLAMRLFRLGSLVEQISPATLTGVKTGVGLTVAVAQLPTLLGLATPADDPGFLGALGDVVSALSTTHVLTAVVSAAAVGTLLVLRRVAPRVPGALVVVAASILLVALTDVEDRGLALIEPVPAGLPGVSLPVWDEVVRLLPGALAIAVMAFLETVLVARAQRQRSEPAIDSDRELLAVGVAALGGGLSQCLPPAGGFSQSAVNLGAGARTQVSGITTAALAVLVALFLAPVLSDLPAATLAALVLVAVVGLVSPAEFVRLYRIDRTELWVAAITTAIGLTAGLLPAVGAGVVLTLFLVLRAVSRSAVRPLHPAPDGGWTTNPPPDGEAAPPRLMLLHLDRTIYTGNARPTQDAVLAAALAADPPPRAVVLEGTAVERATVPLLDAVEGLDADLAREGIRLLLAAFPARVRRRATVSAWWAAAERDGRVLPTVGAAVAAAAPERAAEQATEETTGEATGEAPA
ncbi:SulP family inorganic anion transporter [Promicromonospora sp. NPDC052451]|uniref:SulP family inorganic anion transporter n=1 Tax=Promicromonospora sp. NPDC052451 TaxID=3364407 RepID=UPI0037C70C8A